MRRPALRAALAAVALVAAATGPGLRPAEAHLRRAPAGLVRMMGGAAGMLVARSQEATVVEGETAPRPARAATAATASATRRQGRRGTTPFVALDAIAGRTPRGAFTLDAGAPVLRYPAGQTAIVLVAPGESGGAQRWLSPQTAAAALPVAGARLDPQSRASLKALWDAVHATPDGAVGGEAVAAALTALLRAPERRLRLVAVLDLAELAHHGEAFSPATRATLAGLVADPAADPAVKPAVVSLLRALTGSGA